MGRWKKAKSPTQQQDRAGAPGLEPRAARAGARTQVAGTDDPVDTATDELVSEPTGSHEPASHQDAHAQPATAAKRLSALDAASLVLVQTGTPMNCQELVGLMAVRGLWSTPKGKTPAATLYSALIRDITAKGRDSRFKKTGRGSFASNLPTPHIGEGS